jgi:hypothetical protein
MSRIVIVILIYHRHKPIDSILSFCLDISGFPASRFVLSVPLTHAGTPRHGTAHFGPQYRFLPTTKNKSVNAQPFVAFVL